MNQPQIVLPFDPADLLVEVARNGIVMAFHFAAALPWWGWPALALAVYLRVKSATRQRRVRVRH